MKEHASKSPLWDQLYEAIRQAATQAEAKYERSQGGEPARERSPLDEEQRGERTNPRAELGGER